MKGLLSSLPKRSEWKLPVWTRWKNYFFEEFRVSFEISLCANGATRFTFKYLDHEWRRETWPVLTTLNQRFPDHFENKIAKFFITHIFSRSPWGFNHLKCRKNSLSKPLFRYNLFSKANHDLITNTTDSDFSHSTRFRPTTCFETVLVTINFNPLWFQKRSIQWCELIRDEHVRNNSLSSKKYWEL